MTSNEIEISNKRFTEKEWIERFGKGDPDDMKYGKMLGRTFPGVYPRDRKSIVDYGLGAEVDILLYEEDIIKTGDKGEAQVFLNGCMIKMSNRTELRVEQAYKTTTGESSSLIDMVAGTARFFIGKVVGMKNLFKVRTTFAEAGVEGSDFIIQLNENLMTLYSSESTMLTLSNPNGRMTMTGGMGSIEHNQSPRVSEMPPYSEKVRELKLDFACLQNNALLLYRDPFIKGYSFVSIPDDSPPTSASNTDTIFQFEDTKTYPEESIMTNPSADEDTPRPPGPPVN